MEKVKTLLQALACAWACAACSHAVKLSANNSACFNTVSIAFCCLSGGLYRQYSECRFTIGNNIYFSLVQERFGQMWKYLLTVLGK
ncbi:MAG: hypothetical protein IT223_12485 [Crocinitomicaceae bacterium]|nr:hypothetical protein [Crocinitomicaceae bacterium]